MIVIKFQYILFRVSFENGKLMKKCDLCYDQDKVHYRVKSTIHKDWVFCCKECRYIISKQSNYSYGGTRKLKRKKMICSRKNLNFL